MAPSQSNDNKIPGLGLFALLPAELRNGIWRLVLLTSTPNEITHHRNDRPGRKCNEQYTLSSLPASESRLCTALFRANKAKNREAGPFLYSHTHFHFPATAVLDTFVEKVGEMAFSLSTFTLTSLITGIEDAAPLALLRRLHRSRKIVLPVPFGSMPPGGVQAGRAARETWPALKGIVVLRGGGVYALFFPSRARA